jgi:hypothetical protein
MTTLAWTVISLLTAGLAGLGVTTTRTHRRLRTAEQHVAGLEDQLRDVERTSRHAAETARVAEALARRPGGPPPEPPRVVLEPLTGRLVRAVALGAGARRAVTRLARGPRGPQS